MLVRVCVAVVLAGVIGVGLARPGVPSAEPTVTQFLLAWESRHYLQAAELTTGSPKMVATQLADAYERLDAADVDLIMRGVSQHGRTAQASFAVAIDLSGSGLTWAYRNNFRLTDGSDGWRVQWSPSVIVPGMTNDEQLAVVSRWDPRSQLLDSAGQPLALASKVYKVGVIPDQLADPDETAADLGNITQIPKDQIEGQVDQAPSATFISLLTLSPAEYKAMQTSLKRIPGLVIHPRRERLFDSIAPDVVGSVGTETASVLRENGEQYRPGTTVGESGLQQAYQRQLTGTPETEVILQRSGLLVAVLKTFPGSAGKPVHTTLDSTVQTAADQALSDQPTSAAIVAVQADTGKILAVASRTGRGMPALNPLAGEYEPGQAFTIISSAAILSAMPQLSLNDPVPCQRSNSVDGISFRNNPPLSGLGPDPSFQTDFAHACSTAFAGGLAESLSARDLTKASQEFGIGGWRLPGSKIFAGQLGQPANSGVLAEDVIGGGGVRVSPLGMALAAAVVESGGWHAPSLVTDLTDPSAAPPAAARPQVLAELRSLMGEAASTGSNAVADVGRDVYGQAGSAPYGSGRLWLDWFVGYQKDVAFAVVKLSTSAGTSAAPLAGSFLQDIRPGS
jgi:cell division protein FtsI/penicillin-binding protein 2